MSIYIYTNGSIYSPADPYATALLTENGTVTWIGSDAGARSITDERMRAIDLNGKLITPTFARAFAPINNHSEKTLYEYFLRTHTQGYHTHTLAGTIRDIPALHTSLDMFYTTHATVPDVRFFIIPEPQATSASYAELVTTAQDLLNKSSIALTGFHATNLDHLPTLASEAAEHGLVLSINTQDSFTNAFSYALAVREQHPWLNIRLDMVYGVIDDQRLQDLADARISLGIQATFDTETAKLAHRANAAGTVFALGSDSSLVEVPLGWELISALIKSADGISARSGFAALTRGVYRLAHDENPFAGQILPDTPANIALWNVTELMVQTPDSRVASWSTDPRARIPLLPVLASDVPLPVLDRMYTRGGE